MLGPLSEEDNPNYAELYSFGDLDALFDLYGHLRATNPATPVHIRRGTTPDLPNHLVVLGGIAWNDVPRRLNEMLALPVRQVVDEKIHSGEIFVANVGDDRGRESRPRWREDDAGTSDKPGVLLEDVGDAGPAAQSLQRAPDPDLLQWDPQPRSTRSGAEPDRSRPFVMTTSGTWRRHFRI